MKNKVRILSTHNYISHPFIFLKKISLSILIMIVLFVICLAGLFAVAEMAFKDKSLVFDNDVFNFIHPHVNNLRTQIMLVITFLGSQNFLLPANLLLIMYFLFGKKNKRTALQITAVSVTSVLVMFTLKLILQRERPPMPLIAKVHGFSFPSGHTFTSVTFYGILAYIAYRNIHNVYLKWSVIIFLICFVFLVGFSRVYLKLHYASDVIAGFCLGTIWLILAKWFLLKTETTKLQSNL